MSFDDKDGAGQATDIPHKEDKNDQVENNDRSDSLHIYISCLLTIQNCSTVQSQLNSINFN